MGFFDAQGCLTPEAFALIAASPPGRAPAELAAHLAGCARCQRRVLASSSPRSTAMRRERPPLWRTGAVGLAAILLVIAALVVLRYLTTAPR